MLKVKEKTAFRIASYRKFTDSREQVKVKIANEILFILVAWQLLPSLARRVKRAVLFSATQSDSKSILKPTYLWRRSYKEFVRGVATMGFAALIGVVAGSAAPTIPDFQKTTEDSYYESRNHKRRRNDDTLFPGTGALALVLWIGATPSSRAYCSSHSPSDCALVVKVAHAADEHCRGMSGTGTALANAKNKVQSNSRRPRWQKRNSKKR